MTFWAAAAIMALLATGFILWSLLRRGPSAAPSAAYDEEVYRDQLREIERDRGRGLIGTAEAEAARAEVARRLLAREAELSQAPADAEPRGSKRRLALLRALVLASIAFVPLATFGLYLLLGSPGTPSLPIAQRASESPEDIETLTLVERLAQRMAEHPEDPEGWRLLGRAYGDLGRYGEAAEAYRQALARGAESGALLANLGEALTAEAGGRVTEEAKSAFEKAVAVEPSEPRAAYYLGLAAAQAGDNAAAIARWQGLLEASPPDAPWRALVESQIRAALAEGAGGTGPSAADVEAAAAMTAEERAAFIDQMVAGLAARLEREPEDLTGWIRLTRAYAVLDRPEEAREAARRVSELAGARSADDPERREAEALLEALGLP